MLTSKSDGTKASSKIMGGKSGKAPAAFKGITTKNIKQDFSIFTGDVKNSFWGFIQKLEKFRNIVQNNYDLGRMHLGLGNLRDALLRFKFVLWLEPTHVNAMYYLGATYIANGNKPEAAKWLTKALKLKPGFEEAKYLLSVVSTRPVSGADMPRRMPVTLAEEYFDSIAGDYNLQQLELLKYEGHIQLDNALRSCVTPGRMDCLVLDLGVGTGLCGPGIRDIAAHLSGVDLSSRMLDQAVTLVDNNDKKIYDALIKREAFDFLSDSKDASYDIILSAGMFSYIGDLEGIFMQSGRVLKQAGLFAFTADVTQGEGYEFHPADARFHFSKSYLQELAARCGFKELRFKDLAIYADSPAWVCVYQKG